MRTGPDAWTPRQRPLEPTAVVGLGAVGRALGRRVLALAPAGWRGAAGSGVAIFEGPGGALPWVDGAIYLGRDPRAPELLLPTAWTPPVHPALLHQRLGAAALILDPPRVLPLGRLGPLDLGVLERWVEADR